MTREVVATGLGVSRQRVHQLIREGKLQVVRVGARDYVPLTAFRTVTGERFRAAS
jgi:excisionase family DNA binding protein